MEKEFDEIEILAESLRKGNPNLTKRQARKLAISKLNAAADQIGGGFDLGSKDKDGKIKTFSFFRKRKK